MSFHSPDTTRIGGGSSARLAAIVAAVALAGVVGVAVLGRPPAEPMPSQPPGAGVASTATPTAPASTASASPTHSPAPTRGPARSPSPVVPPPPLQDEALAIIIHGTDRPRGYLAILHESKPGVLAADIRVAGGAGMAGGTLQLAQLWTREDGPPFVVIDTFHLPADLLTDEAEGATVIEASAPPRPQAETAPRVLRLGYRLRVRLEMRDEQPLLAVTLAVGSPTPWRVDRDGLMSHPEAAEWGITR